MKDPVEKYERELAALSGYTHDRNRRLPGLVHLGLSARRDTGRIFDEIIAAGGEPRLTDVEVRRAIEAALRTHKDYHPSSTHTLKRRRSAALSPRKPAGPNEREQSFVRDLIAAGKGARSRDLSAASPCPVIGEGVIGAFLNRLFKPGELIFSGNPYLPRTRENLKTAEQIVAEITAGAAIPTHFVPNPFTGEPGTNAEGKVSYCLDATVAHRRMALVEFDALPLEEQAAFWMGALRERLLPVRTLVFSGAKSIHGLIELKEDSTVELWKSQWQTLERLLCSDPEAKYRCDVACKNPGRMTRFPGARRPDAKYRQSLLYLSA